MIESVIAFIDAAGGAQAATIVVLAAGMAGVLAHHEVSLRLRGRP